MNEVRAEHVDGVGVDERRLDARAGAPRLEAVRRVDEPLPTEERGVDEEVREAERLEHLLEPGRVRALRQPDAARIDADAPPRGARADRELRGDRGRIEQRQIAMRRTRGEDLDVATPREVGERADEIVREALRVRVAVRAEEREVVERERAPLGIAITSEPFGVLLRTPDLIVAVLDEAVVDVRIRELLEEGRRETDGHAVRDARVAEIVEQAEEWKVRSEDGLVHPFLTVRPTAGAARVRQMRVEDEGECLCHP